MWGENGQVNLSSTNDTSGNTVVIYNVNLILDKDMDLSKLADTIKEIAKTAPIRVNRY